MRERDTVTALGQQAKIIVHEVDWVTATQELSKLLIPQDRQTKSCTAEELAGPKVEKKQPAPAAVAEAEKPRQLRTRAAAVKPAPRAESSDRRPKQPRAVSRTDRRRTIADLPSSTETVPQVQPRRTSRRSSMASSLSTPSTEPDGFGVPPPQVPQLPASASTMDAMKPPPKPSATNGGVQVKKTRPLPVKPAVPSRGPAPNGAPVPPTVGFKPASETASVPNPAIAPAPAAGSQGFADLDALVNKTSKLRLNAPASKEEHERKLKEKLAAERRASALKGAETRRVNAAARKAKEVAVPVPKGAPAAFGAGLTPAQRARMGPPVQSDIVPAATVPQQPAAMQQIVTQPQVEGDTLNGVPLPTLPLQGQPQQQPDPFTAPAAPLIEPAVTSPPSAPTIPSAPVFESPVEPVQPPPAPELPVAPTFTAPPAPPAVATTSPPTPLSTQSGPDSAARQPLHEQDLADNLPRHEGPATPVRPSSKSSNAPLPVFSATGVIPFAAQPSPTPVEVKPEGHRRLTSLDNGNGVSRSMHDRSAMEENIEHVGMAEQKEVKGKGDVWEVPETPVK